MCILCVSGVRKFITHLNLNYPSITFHRELITVPLNNISLQFMMLVVFSRSSSPTPISELASTQLSQNIIATRLATTSCVLPLLRKPLTDLSCEHRLSSGFTWPEYILGFDHYASMQQQTIRLISLIGSRSHGIGRLHSI